MLMATARSGQRLRAPYTPPAASIIATFPMASLRPHNNTYRILGSPSRQPRPQGLSETWTDRGFRSAGRVATTGTRDFCPNITGSPRIEPRVVTFRSSSSLVVLAGGAHWFFTELVGAPAPNPVALECSNGGAREHLDDSPLDDERDMRATRGASSHACCARNNYEKRLDRRFPEPRSPCSYRFVCSAGRPRRAVCSFCAGCAHAVDAASSLRSGPCARSARRARSA